LAGARGEETGDVGLETGVEEDRCRCTAARRAVGADDEELEVMARSMR
jgi:hypothetical protein